MAGKPAIFDVDLRLGNQIVRTGHVPIPDLNGQDRLQRQFRLELVGSNREKAEHPR